MPAMGGDNAIDVPQPKLWGTRSPVPNGSTLHGAYARLYRPTVTIRYSLLCITCNAYIDCVQ